MSQGLADRELWGPTVDVASGIRERALALRSVECLAELDEESLALLAEHARLRSHRAGAVLLAGPGGGPPTSFHVVRSGRIVLSRGERTSRVEGGDIGMLAILGGAEADRAVAETDARTLEIPAPALLAAVEESFPLLRSLLQRCGREILRSRAQLPAPAIEPPAEGEYPERPYSLVERLLLLRKTPFGNMNVEALVDLARHMIEVREPAGTVLWRLGERSTHALHITHGVVRCSVHDRHVDVSGNYTLGVMDVWGGQVRAYEARAVAPVAGWRVDFETFLTILETHGSVGIGLLRGLAQVASEGA